jgi:hypothetical protein
MPTSGLQKKLVKLTAIFAMATPNTSRAFVGQLNGYLNQLSLQPAHDFTAKQF